MLYFMGHIDHTQNVCFHFTNKDDQFGLINQGLSFLIWLDCFSASRPLVTVALSPTECASETL